MRYEPATPTIDLAKIDQAAAIAARTFAREGWVYGLPPSYVPDQAQLCGRLLWLAERALNGERSDNGRLLVRREHDGPTSSHLTAWTKLGVVSDFAVGDPVFDQQAPPNLRLV